MTAGSAVMDSISKPDLKRLEFLRKKKPNRGTQEWKEMCILKKKVLDIIDPKCFCDCNDNGYISGSVNWLDPPEDLPLNEWEEIFENYSSSKKNRFFRNKQTGELVRKDDNDHYHRYNPNIKVLEDRSIYKDTKDLYMDNCGKILEMNNHKNNHIYIERKTYKIKEEEICDERNIN